MSGTSEEMVCDELAGLVTSYIEGTLPETDRGRLERHLTECPWCEDYIAQHREVVSALRRLDEGEPASAGEEPMLTELLTVLRERRGDETAELP